MTACREEHPSYSLQTNDHADDDYSSSQVEPYPLSEDSGTVDAVDVDDILCIASCSVSTTTIDEDEGSNSASGSSSSSSIRCVWLEVGVRGVYCWIPSPSPVLRRDRETRQVMPRLLHLSPWPADRLTLSRNHCFSTGLFPHPPVHIEVSPSAAAAVMF